MFDADRDPSIGPTSAPFLRDTIVANAERQLRLGLGQVLRYRQAMQATKSTVVAVLMVEQQPRDASWGNLCAALDVRLMWPGRAIAHLRPTGSPLHLTVSGGASRIGLSMLSAAVGVAGR